MHMRRFSTQQNFTAARRTRLLQAVMRDLNHRSPAPLLVDPQAATLLEYVMSDEDRAILEAHPLSSACQDVTVMRTRALDRWLERPTWPPVRTTRRQTVLFGAAADTRPYRFGFSRYVQTVFEVDADEALLKAKHEAIAAAGFAPRCDVRIVGCDLSDTKAIEARLVAAGYDPLLPTRWVGEALEYAAQPAALFALANRMGGRPGSGCAATLLDPSFAARLTALAEGADAVQPYVEDLPSVGSVLASMRNAGWVNVRNLTREELSEACGGRAVPGALHVVVGDAHHTE